MAYVRVGTYKGEIETLKNITRSLSLDESPSGYGSTSDRHQRVRTVFNPVLSSYLPGDWPYSMVTVVHPNGSIPPHHDGPLSLGFHRFHIVLASNDRSWCMHDSSWQQLEVGGVFVMDCTKEHAAVNWGGEDRIHLVVDAEAPSWFMQ